jgi:hypothetical protein
MKRTIGTAGNRRGEWPFSGASSRAMPTSPIKAPTMMTPRPRMMRKSPGWLKERMLESLPFDQESPSRPMNPG